MNTFSIGSRVEGGEPYTEDHDEGTIESISGAFAQVAWQSGVTTTCDLATLRSGWSGRFVPRDDED